MQVTLTSYTIGMESEPPERLIEKAARISYESFNNISKNSHERLIKNLIKLGHLSPLEFADATFEISDVSRALLAQLTRHRLASFMVRSQRYVNEDNFNFVVPDDIEVNDDAYDLYWSAMVGLRDVYKELLKLGIKKEDARFILPNGTTTHLFMKANFREWLHIIKLRVSKEAQWEIQDLLVRIWQQLYEIAPNVFGITYFEGDKFKEEIFYEIIS